MNIIYNDIENIKKMNCQNIKKNINCLQINPTKGVQDLCSEDCKNMAARNQSRLNTGGDTGVRASNDSMFLKAQFVLNLSRFNTLPKSQLFFFFFAGIDIPILKFI